MALSHRHHDEEWKSYRDPTITASGTIKTTNGMLINGTGQPLQTIYNNACSLSPPKSSDAAAYVIGV